jgi:hypothetical protein
MSERFELIGEQGDISGHVRLAYASALDDPTPFVITLPPQYVARVQDKTITFQEITRYAYDHAADLRGYGVSGKGKRALEPCSGITRRL